VDAEDFDMWRRLAFLSALLAALVWAWPMPGRAAEPAADVESGDRDLTSFAEFRGVSIEVARQQLKFEAAAGGLESTLREVDPDGFAGLWIERTPQLHVVVAVTAPRDSLLAGLTSGSPLQGHVETILVSRSYEELARDADAILSEVDGRYSLEIDVKRNAIELLTLHSDMTRTKALVDQVGVETDASVAASRWMPEPAAYAYGGLSLGGQACTTGFTVRKAGTTTDGVTTAGHCSNNLTLHGQAITYQAGSTVGSNDSQWHTTPFVEKPWFQSTSGGSYRIVYGRKFWSQQPQGATVCKYGRVTLYTCGEIVSKSIAPPYITNPTATFIQVSRSGKITADAGDSGGPVFLVSDAWGVVSGFLYRGGNPVTQDLIYEAEDKVEIALNVTVRTDPP
jgi:hypothetical protein